MAELNAITRKEKFLAKAAGQNVETPQPITREEIFLSKIAGGGGNTPGGGGSAENNKIIIDLWADGERGEILMELLTTGGGVRKIDTERLFGYYSNEQLVNSDILVSLPATLDDGSECLIPATKIVEREPGGYNYYFRGISCRYTSFVPYYFDAPVFVNCDCEIIYEYIIMKVDITPVEMPAD